MPETSRGTVRRGLRLDRTLRKNLTAGAMGTVLGLAAPSPAGVPSPQRLGYSSVVLDRLARHACVVLGFEQAWVVVRAPEEPRGFIVVAGGGPRPGPVGRRGDPAGPGSG